MIENQYYKQIELVAKLLPFLESETDFALKGGTAINYFVRNYPRISVDIDLTFLPILNRADTLQKISTMLERYEKFAKNRIYEIEIIEKKLKEGNFLKGLVVKKGNITVKIEPNLVIRGSVFPPEKRYLTQGSTNLLQREIVLQTLSIPDLYGGKICAALDRQHPRDLFDIAILFRNEMITADIRKAFIVYLLSHSRPISELLKPNQLDISNIYRSEFAGMTRIEMTLEELYKTRERLIKKLNDTLTENEKRFILSFKSMKPKWELFELDNISELPAIKWKLYNLSQMETQKHKNALDKLAQHLEVELKDI